MRQSRNGQAALEFLATYGWAIMVVLVMIGALAYFGVLNPSNFLPEKCIFTTGISCKDNIVENNGGNLRLRFIIENGMGTGITLNTNPIATYGGVVVTCANGSIPDTISAGDSRMYTCPTGAPAPWPWKSPGVGQNFKATIALNYTEVGGVFVHPVVGEIQLKVQ